MFCYLEAQSYLCWLYRVEYRGIMNSELKVCGRKLSWSILGYLHIILMDKLGKASDSIGEFSQCPDRDF